MSRETDAIVAYGVASGVPMFRSSWYCLGHAPGGYHCQQGTDGLGTAVDFQDPAPRDQAQLLAIFNAFLKVEGQLAELIYSGAGFSIKDGKRVPRYAISAHYNHVHVAVKRGTFIKWPTPAPVPVPAPAPRVTVTPMFNPPLQIVAYLDCPTGGTWCLAPDGAVFAFGGAPYLGGCNGKPYFVGRTAARFNLVDGKYQIVATSGELYGPGF